MMKQIFQDIAFKEGVEYSMNKASWFNGEMMCPVKNYDLKFPVPNGYLRLQGEYRRNTYHGSFWSAGTNQVDLQNWNITMMLSTNWERFTVFKSIWIERNLFGKSGFIARCKNFDFKQVLGSMEVFDRLFNSSNESLDGRILGKMTSKGYRVRSGFTTRYDHEYLVGTIVQAFKEIASLLERNKNRFELSLKH